MLAQLPPELVTLIALQCNDTPTLPRVELYNASATHFFPFFFAAGSGAAAAAGAALRPPGSHASSANSLFSVNEAPPTETFTMDRTGGSLGN